MHSIMLAMTGLLGMFIGLHVVLSLPMYAMWGHCGLISGFTLFAFGVIQDYEQT
jgi:hypothetical protein